MTDDPPTDGQVRKRRPSPTDEEILSAVYRYTPAGTSEVAEAIGQSRQAAEYRLKHLEKVGALYSKLVGPTRVWIHPDAMKVDFAPE